MLGSDGGRVRERVGGRVERRRIVRRDGEGVEPGGAGGEVVEFLEGRG